MTASFVPWSTRKNAPGWITNEAGCDIWQGCTTTDGYGMARIDGRMCVVTRVRYEREIGPIPEGAELDHYVCNNGAGGCCNPHHCRPVTHRENMLRSGSVAAICAAKMHCSKGHPLSGENLRRSDLARGQRACRICANARARARWVPRKERKERAAVRRRDMVAQVAPVFSSDNRVAEAEAELKLAGDQLDMAIYAVADRLYDLAKGDGQ